MKPFLSLVLLLGGLAALAAQAPGQSRDAARVDERIRALQQESARWRVSRGRW